MVGLTELAPNPFGGFAPFPNSIMIPFMGAQSAVLGYDFGLSYEAGKRMIKSMDNADFNQFVKDGQLVKFEGKEMNLLSVFAKKHYREEMKQFTDNIPDALRLQDTIIEASVAIELKKAQRTPSAMVEIIKAFAAAGGETVVEELDKQPAGERHFIMTTVPILGLIYAMTKFGGGQEFDIPPGTPKEPEPPLPEPPLNPPDAPISPTPPSDPTPPPVTINKDQISVTITYTWLDHNGNSIKASTTGNLAYHRDVVAQLEAWVTRTAQIYGNQHFTHKNAIRKLLAYRNALKAHYDRWI